MKKKIILGAALLAAIGASASVGIITWCGVEVVTVSSDFFEGNPEEQIQEAKDYYQELNIIHCGAPGPYTIIP